jgi:hypothetical protein
MDRTTFAADGRKRAVHANQVLLNPTYTACGFKNNLVGRNTASSIQRTPQSWSSDVGPLYSRKRRAELQAQTFGKRRSIENSDVRNEAQCHPYPHMPPGPSLNERFRDCRICGDEGLAAENTFTCSQDHSACRVCFSRYITETWFQKRMDDNDTQPELRCMFRFCCSEPLTDTQVARHASDAAFARYLEKKQNHRDGLVYADAVQLVLQVTRNVEGMSEEQRKAVDEAERKLLQHQLNRTMKNALMCPRCKWGPIELFACGDLQSHHDEGTMSGSKIDNRCANCRFFSYHVSGWATWDGILRDAQTEVAPDGSHSEPQVPPVSQASATSVSQPARGTMQSLHGTSPPWSGEQSSVLPAEQSRDYRDSPLVTRDRIAPLEAENRNRNQEMDQ